jgi:hypothetical protein
VFPTESGHAGPIRSRHLLLAALAAATALAACGGGGQADKPSVPTTVDSKAFKACLDGAGLEYERRYFGPRSRQRPAGLTGFRLEVPLGQASPKDPAQPGTFDYYAHVHVFDTAAHAEAFDATASGDNFVDGEVSRNAYAGYNLDAAKVPATPNGDKFLTCLRNS